MDEKLEIDYRSSCRICLKISENLRDLFGLTFPKDDSVTVDFLRKMTGLQIQCSDSLPKNICDKCTKDVFAAFELAKMCIISDARLRNQETRIKAEVIKEEEPSINSEPLSESDSVQYEIQNKDDFLLDVNDTDELPYPCTKCDKGCSTAESLRLHLKIHDENHPKKCHICNRTFRYPRILADHMINHTGEMPLLCRTCGKYFRESDALHFHQRIHSEDKPFPCTYCKEIFMTRKILEEHICKHTNEKPFVCHTCGVSFRKSTDLKSHRRVHTGGKQEVCSVCGKRVNSSVQLTVHMRLHTGEKPFDCETCSKSFISKSILRKHKRFHTGQRPYECELCGRTFSQSSALHKHNRRVHKISDVEQVKCGIETTNRIEPVATQNEKPRDSLIAELQQKTLDIFQHPHLDSGELDSSATIAETVKFPVEVAVSDEMISNRVTNSLELSTSQMDVNEEK